jgi:hypothetical protein
VYASGHLDDCKLQEVDTSKSSFIIETGQLVTPVEPITEVCHPLLDLSNKKKEEDKECESNNIVIVEYRGIKYRIDFSKEDELVLLPRQLKKSIALADIKQTVDAEEKEKERQEAADLKLKKQDPRFHNAMVQDSKRQGIIERLRAKLYKTNPIKYKEMAR